MDETFSSPDQPESAPPLFKWHISKDQLLEMSEQHRAIYLNEKTSRLYEAIKAISTGEPDSPATLEHIDAILNPENMGEDRSAD